MLCVPAAREPVPQTAVDELALDAPSGSDEQPAIALPLARKVTVPPGAAPFPATDALKNTSVPLAAGMAELIRLMLAGCAGCVGVAETVWLTEAEVLPSKLESPEYCAV